jgi:transcriptional regulator with XRE-family HTH domain
MAAGMTQAELAAKIGVDRAYVSGLELGERNATILTVWHVAQALGVKVGALFREARSGRR